MPSRVILTRGTPTVCRVVRAAPTPSTSRSMSLFPTPFGPYAVSPRHFGFPTSSLPFQPYVSSFDREVAPLFKLMDDMSRHFDQHFLAPINAAQAAPTPFTPRFDVREVEGAYELRGELPGVEASNLQVEFTDPTTLVIRGKTETHTSTGPEPTTTGNAVAANEASPQDSQTAEAAVPASEDVKTSGVADDAASTHSSSSYVKPTVEDEATIYDDNAPSTPGQATPAESVVAEAAPATASAEVPTAEQAVTNTQATNNAQYHITERRTGTFQRVFNFPGRVDQEGVTASLKNGVLEVRVPKVAVQQRRRIVVQ